MPRLSVDDAAIIKGLRKLKHPNEIIAAYFGVNQGRIAEINTGQIHADVPAAPAHRCPSVDDLHHGRALATALAAVRTARAALDGAEAMLLAVAAASVESKHKLAPGRHRRMRGFRAEPEFDRMLSPRPGHA